MQSVCGVKLSWRHVESRSGGDALEIRQWVKERTEDAFVAEPRSFIVRIYRKGARSLAGTVQDAAYGSMAPFQSMEELWTLLRSDRFRRKRGSRSGAGGAPGPESDSS